MSKWIYELYQKEPTDESWRFNVGDKVLAVGNYEDEQLGEYAYPFEQTVSEVKPRSDGKAQLVLVKDGWISSGWFVLAQTKEATDG